jgi:methylase of polypeptide subunit release factors
MSTVKTTGPARDSSGSARVAQMLFRTGSDADFAGVRDFLVSVGFTEAAVLAALQVSDVSQIPKATAASAKGASISRALLAVIDLFVLGNAIAAADLRSSWGEDTFNAAAGLGLLREAQDFTALQTCPIGTVICPVWLYPVDGFFIVSDRTTDLENRASGATTQVVFPAHDFGTLQLLRLLPTATVGEALDLCGGSGIGALHLARNGTRATTSDLTHRSAHFAEFNARLNGIAIESLQGDLYTSVAGREFDVISAHPPWLPSIGDAIAFRDGGETGEEVTQGIFRGLAHHLRPGGTAIVVSLGRDDRDAHYEHRVRHWLGDAGQNCDVILGVDKLLSVDEVLNSMCRLHLKDDVAKVERIAAHYGELGTEQFVHGAVFVRRTVAKVIDAPLRVRMLSGATADDFERIFAWRQCRRQPEFGDWLKDARPHLSPRLESNVRYVVRGGRLVADTMVFKIKAQLSTAVQPDVWMARLLERLDGTHTVAQIYNPARASGELPPDFELGSFVDFVSKMIEYGLLEINAPFD